MRPALPAHPPPPRHHKPYRWSCRMIITITQPGFARVHLRIMKRARLDQVMGTAAGPDDPVSPAAAAKNTVQRSADSTECHRSYEGLAAS
jgi:hypothetical protein